MQKLAFCRNSVMKIAALIMAGGHGERFWPRSRKSLPKQFLSLDGSGRTMIQSTVARILPLIGMDDIFIATSNGYRGLVEKQLPDLPKKNILCEPFRRNTASCIGLGAVHIAHKYEKALMVVLPADHLIKRNDIFVDVLKNACVLAEEGENLITIGIAPNYPETGYGYIKFNPSIAKGEGFAVERFVEKPCLEAAKEYLKKGGYLWNSGIFVWKTSSILKNIKQFMPGTFEGLMHIQSAIGRKEEELVLEEEFQNFAPESIDYGIMEKASNIYVLSGAFGWDDVGSWLALERVRGRDGFGNVVKGDAIMVNSKNCIVEGNGRLIAAVGLEDIILVDSADVVLVCGKRSTEDIKKVLEYLKSRKKEEYL